jgi:hypothetical protein
LDHHILAFGDAFGDAFVWCHDSMLHLSRTSA